MMILGPKTDLMNTWRVKVQLGSLGCLDPEQFGSGSQITIALVNCNKICISAWNTRCFSWKRITFPLVSPKFKTLFQQLLSNTLSNRYNIQTDAIIAGVVPMYPTLSVSGVTKWFSKHGMFYSKEHHLSRQPISRPPRVRISEFCDKGAKTMPSKRMGKTSPSSRGVQIQKQGEVEATKNVSHL